MGSCGTCYSCKKELMSVEEAFKIRNPILLYEECEEKIKQIGQLVYDMWNVLDLKNNKGKFNIVIPKGE